MKSISIVGGGIGGLCAAIGLQQLGCTVHVYEAAQELRPLGAGLILAANSVRALHKLDLDTVVQAIGLPFDQIAILDQQGNIINKTKMSEISREFGAGNFSVHRADLHKVLVSQLKSGTLKLAKRCTEVKADKQQVILTFADGSQAVTSALIAFDGIHSFVRKTLLPQIELRYAGYTCWRAVIPYQFRSQSQQFTETWGKDGRFGIVPLTDGQVYWFATINASVNDTQMQAYRVADLQQNFRNYHSLVTDVLKNTPDKSLLWNDITDFVPINQYAFGNIVLAGDAAHAMTPNMGQGAGMAIEDAAVLTSCVAQYPNIQEAFQQFEQRRIKRVSSMVNKSFQLGKIAQHLPPQFHGLRNSLFRMIPDWVNQRQMREIYKVALDD